jgi:hypothetical protein
MICGDDMLEDKDIMKSRLLRESATVAVYETPMRVDDIPRNFFALGCYPIFQQEMAGKEIVYVYSSVASLDDHARVTGYSAQPAGPAQNLDDQYRMAREGAGYGTIEFLEGQFNKGGMKRHIPTIPGRKVKFLALDSRGALVASLLQQS